MSRKRVSAFLGIGRGADELAFQLERNRRGKMRIIQEHFGTVFYSDQEVITALADLGIHWDDVPGRKWWQIFTSNTEVKITNSITILNRNYDQRYIKQQHTLN